MKEQLLNAKSWEERYRLIIQAGKQLPFPTEQQLAEMQPISGCEAKVWFKIAGKNDRTFDFQAYSEARIINGLLWILLQEIQGKTVEQLKQFDLTAYFTELGIAQRLSSTRLNGLKQIEKLLHQLE
ncbi:SufE family protein [Pasteurella multocida]|uniref:SufE family protein n=1 Tax=Pasteurella multocida TaxID=747 RepID=UPI0029304464|nr:SufE family protein [Pasteurella multocida]